MKVSLRWLSEFIDLPTQDPGEIEGVLSSLGFEVEGIEPLVTDFTGVLTARVESIELHPEAQKVRLCRLSTGGPSIDVWCGAWNFEEGAVVAYAPPGAVLAGGFELGVRRMFGVDSNGMITSEAELGLGDDHAGILVLDPGTPLATDFATLIDRPDWVFDLSITPNRPDAMSMLGIARELGAYYEVEPRFPETAVVEAEEQSRVSIRIDDATGCYRFNGREVVGVNIGPSPLWMRMRLRAAGIRAISNVVDITNYVMLELGQPLHAFDLDRIAGETVIVRRAAAGERLVTLDGVERQLISEDLVVADAAGASALAGTMGGADSEVSAGTRRVLIEGAAWDPPTILFMSHRHGLRSEASARFERGVDPGLGPSAVARAARLMVEVAGGRALGGAQDVIATEVAPAVIDLTVSDVARLLGPGIDGTSIANLLTRLGCQTEGTDPIRVTVPTFRRDLTRPVDLVEEVARLHGYHRFGETVPFGSGGGWSVSQRRRRVVQATLTGLGMSQIVPLSFMAAEDLDGLGIPETDERRRTIRVRNPLREEESALRTTLLPGLLRAARYNLAHGAGSVALFETGLVFLDRASPDYPQLPEQPLRLGFVIVGGFGSAIMGGPSRPADVFTATAVWRVLVDSLGLKDQGLDPAEVPGFHPGRCARVLVDGSEVGVLGELHPAAARFFDLPGRVSAGELDLDSMLAPRRRWQFVEPSSFPPITFDLAFELDETVTADALVRTTAAAAGDLVETVRVFDEFRGAGLGPGRKSLALTYILRAPDRTLSNEDVVPVRQAMIAAAAHLGATLRGPLTGGPA